MKRKPIGKDHKCLQAGDEGVLISLVYDFQEHKLVEYRTGYKVSYGPGIVPQPGVIVYKMPNPHIKATGEYTKTMSLERIGQYELMSCKTAHQHYHRQYGRMFTITLRLDHDRARFWKQIQRATLDKLRGVCNQTGFRTDRWNFEPLVKPNF